MFSRNVSRKDRLDFVSTMSKVEKACPDRGGVLTA